MPTLDDLLSQTMLFEGAKGSNQTPNPVALKPVRLPSPKLPKPITMAESRPDERRVAALHNAIWQFSWAPGAPNVFSNVTILTRGMEMDYGMEAKVFDKVEFEGVKIQRQNGEEIVLDLGPAFMIGAWWSRVGTISGDSSLWPLRAKLDASMLVAFGYQLTDAGIEPLTMDEVQEYGKSLMPGADIPLCLRMVAGQDPKGFVCVGPSRYIVVVEFVLCKERPDFVPGELVGFARIHPHAYVWSNEKLAATEVRIALVRPAKGMACGEGMKEEIGSLVVTDTNDVHSGSAWFNVPIPYTDNLYDYYDDNPHRTFKDRKLVRDQKKSMDNDHPLQLPGEICLADARQREERTIDKAVNRATIMVRNKRDIRKCKRQGQFDNIHLASRMRMEFTASDGKLGTDDPKVVLDDIVMINLCMHDCVHTHVRWSEFLESKLLAGWGPDGPNTTPGVPAVPPNQSVFASFPSPHAYTYRAVAEGCEAGAMQVFCHHGMAYAVDVWPTVLAVANTQGLLARVAAQAIVNDEPYRAQMPVLPTFTEFYWRVRYTGTFGTRPIERLTWPSLEKCMR